MKFILLSVSAAILMACTNNQIHGAVQAHEQMECQKLPQNQYEQCMAEVSETYEDYSRKRQDAIETE